MNLRTGRAGVKVLQKMAGRSPQKVAILIGFLIGPLGVSAFSAFKKSLLRRGRKDTQRTAEKTWSQNSLFVQSRWRLRFFFQSFD